MPDEPYNALPLRMTLAWSCAGLCATAHEVLGAVLGDLWPIPTKGLVSHLPPAVIARRIDKSKRMVNDAIKQLDAAGLLHRQEDDSLRLVLDVPAHLDARVEAWFVRIAGAKPAEWAENRSRVGSFPPTSREMGGFPPISSEKPPDAYSDRAGGLHQTTNLSSSSSKKPPAGESTPRAKAPEPAPVQGDDDELVFKKVLKSLLPGLATAIAKQTRGNRELVLEGLLTVKAPAKPLAHAVASVLVAVRDQGFKIKQSPVGVLFHALKHPEDYPAIDPRLEASRVEQQLTADQEAEGQAREKSRRRMAQDAEAAREAAERQEAEKKRRQQQAAEAEARETPLADAFANRPREEQDAAIDAWRKSRGWPLQFETLERFWLPSRPDWRSEQLAAALRPALARAELIANELVKLNAGQASRARG